MLTSIRRGDTGVGYADAVRRYRVACDRHDDEPRARGDARGRAHKALMRGHSAVSCRTLRSAKRCSI